MKSKIIPAVLLTGVVILGGWLAVNQLANKNSSKPASQTHPAKTKKVGYDLVDKVGEVFISSNTFGPRKLTIKKGTKVIWLNLESASHQIVADSGPAGLKSPVLAQGKNYSFTFKSSGQFAYHDALHPEVKGTVTVE
jgi:plastocyanin